MGHSSTRMQVYPSHTRPICLWYLAHNSLPVALSGAGSGCSSGTGSDQILATDAEDSARETQVVVQELDQIASHLRRHSHHQLRMQAPQQAGCLLGQDSLSDR
ncbi:unnamed protein product [Rhizophagus irregularis]|nr:unnamed protein product [Rhizophagus irregularis]